MGQPIAIDRAGRIFLPIEVRRRLNLGPGSRLMLDVVAQHIELTPEPQADAELVMKASRRTVLRPTDQVGVVYVKFIGTHAQYDAVNAETVEME